MDLDSDLELLEIADDVAWIKAAARAGRVGFWRSDLDTGDIDCTETCKNNIGFPLDEQLTFDKFRERIDAEDRERVAETVRGAIESRGTYAVEYRTTWPDGSVHWISSRGSYVNRGAKGWLLGITQDITEIKELEHALEEQRDANELLTQNTAEGLCFLDADGRMTFMNPAAEKILGWREWEMVGRTPHEVLHYKRPDGTLYPKEECPLSQGVHLRQRVNEYEDWWIHKDGHFVSVVCSCVPVVRDGELRGAVLSLHDITERRRMEDALRDASRAKDEFLATISHELRTPMTAVLGWLQYMKMLPLEGELATAIAHAEESAKAQVEIVDDLLDVSRAITGKLRLHVSDVNLRDVVDAAVRNVERSAEEKRIRLTVDTERSLQVRGDSTRLQQIVSNLLTNALKFTHEQGAVSVVVDQRGGSAIIRVSDSGVGIDAEFLPYVFERFSQASAASHRSTNGLGLGLAIVKQLVELHGGHVRAESEGRGSGATFTVELPAVST